MAAIPLSVMVASSNAARSHVGVASAPQVPPPVYISRDGIRPSKSPTNVTVESMEVTEPPRASRRFPTFNLHLPRRPRLRPLDWSRKQWCLCAGIMLTLVLALVLCAGAAVYDELASKEEHPDKNSLGGNVERAPFVCGTNPSHWKCSVRSAGPKAADMENRAVLVRWMDQHCVWQTPADGGFWLCGAGLGGDHGLPGGEGTWVEKVSDGMMKVGAVGYSMLGGEEA